VSPDVVLTSLPADRVGELLTLQLTVAVTLVHLTTTLIEC
jgi:hypothetical protein